MDEVLLHDIEDRRQEQKKALQLQQEQDLD